MKLITEGDNLPTGWTLSTVAEACRIRDELRFPISVELRGEMQGDFPYYGPTGILDYLDEYRVEGTFALIGEDGDHFLKYTEWPMTQLVSGKFNVNNHAHLIEGGEACLTEWFFYFFHHVDLKPLLSLQGVGRYKLTRGALERLPIVLPPLAEQKAIAAVLSAWDRAIEQTTSLIAAEQRLKQGLMQQLLTGQRRLHGFTAPWCETAFSSFLEESRIPGTHGATAKKLTVKLYGKGVIPKNESRIGSEATQYYRRAAGQFVYSKLDFLNGAFGIVPAHLDGFESTLDVPAFNLSNAVDPRWFVSYVSRSAFYTAHLGLANGGRKARRVNPGDFLGIEVELPGKSEQTKIADAIETFERNLKLLHQELAAFKRQKRGLMQKLLTGEVRVSDRLLKQRAKS